MKNSFYLALGAVIGACAAWVVAKNKYESIIQEEVDSVKAYYKELYSGEEGEPDSANWENGRAVEFEEEEEELAKAYKKHTKSYNNLAGRDAPVEGIDYSAFAQNDYDPAEREGPKEEMFGSGPKIITPEEFTAEVSEYNEMTNEYEVEPYDKITLTYYEIDDVLVDDTDGRQEIVDVEDTIGSEALTRFGEYESNVVYVRNEKLGADYEVIREHLSYTKDVLGYDDP